MSSFLGRTAQFYTMHPRVLLATLMEGAKRTDAGRPDLDLRPPHVLEHRLASAVRDWRSPLAHWSGFLGWVLSPTARHAYCPECFKDDLANGRTPYFRIDWAPVLVTACWTHKTPLFNWEAVDSSGARILPKEWIYKLEGHERIFPDFMKRHVAMLKALSGLAIQTTRAQSVLEAIGRIQSLVEKQFDTSMAEFGYRKSLIDCFRWDFHMVVENAARFDTGSQSAPLADAARPERLNEWFGAFPRTARRRDPGFSTCGLRKTGCVQWRRSVQFFAVRALRSVPAYSARAELGEVWALPFADFDESFTAGLAPDQLEKWTRIQAVLSHRALGEIG